MQRVTQIRGAKLSRQQNRLWYLQQVAGLPLAGEGRRQRLYMYAEAVVEGRLDQGRWQQAWREVLQRQEILRARLRRLPTVEVPLLLVPPLEEYALGCSLLDVRGLPAFQQANEIERVKRWLVERGGEGSEGGIGWGIGRVLICESETRYRLLMVFSALSTDAHTVPLVLDEIAWAYEHKEKPKEQELAYLDVAAWSDEQQAEAQQAVRQFWQQVDVAQLKNQSLPLGRLGEQGNEDLLKRERWEIEAHAWHRLTQQCSKLGVSVESWILACWVLALKRLNEPEVPVIGVQVSGRPFPELRRTIGPLARLVPLQPTYEGVERFVDLVRGVQRLWEQSEQNQLGFGWPEAAAEPMTYPLGFTVMHLPSAWTCGEITFRLADIEIVPEPCTLLLNCQLGQQESFLQIQGNESWRIQRISEILRQVMAQVIEKPEMNARDVRLLNEEQEQKLLKIVTGPDYAWGIKNIETLFKQQARRVPQRSACWERGRVWSYQQLDEHAHRLARQLRRQGVSANELVGICLERGAAFVIALLAVLKAGGGYVPLDPHMPAERLIEQLRDSGARIVVSQRAQEELLRSWEGVRMWKEEWEEATESVKIGEDVWEGQGEGEDVAYMIYTSGSTGKPKGVRISRKSLLNYALGICLELQVNEEEGWHFAAASTVAADLGYTALFGALASGGCVHMLPDEVLTSRERWIRWMREQPIDVLKIVPSHLEALLGEEEEAREILPRRALVLGGEALAGRVVRRVRELGGECEIYNHYGPTETTVGVLMHRVVSKEEEAAPGVALGRALPNTEVYILDRQWRAVPSGVEGEVYVGGIGVGEGYAGRAQETAERYVPDGWSGRRGARVYNTGDKGWIDERGEVRYIGRSDRQIKIRGYRVELGEIEAILKQHKEVRDAVVLWLEREGRLVAYVVRRLGGEEGEEKMRAYLSKRLPEHMVPARVVFLKALPLTANGKIDRQRLLTSDAYAATSSIADEQSAAKAAILPRDAIELQLLRVWEELLQVQPISITDSFFDLGGHSLLAVRLMSQILKIFGQDLALTVLFEHPTIASLAVILRQQLPTSRRPALVPIQARGSRTPFFCVHPAGGNVFCYVDLARYLGNDQPFYGLQMPDSDATHNELKYIEDIAAYYITAIQTIQPEGPYLLGGWSMGGVVAFEMAQQLYAQGHEVALLALIDSMIANERLRARAIDNPVDIGDEDIIRWLIAQFEIKVPDDIKQLELHKRLAYVIERAKEQENIPVDASIDQVRYFVRMYRTNSRLAHLYVPQIYQQRIDYFASSVSLGGQKLSEEFNDVSEAPVEMNSKLNAWYAIAKGGMEVHAIPGDHNSMITEPNVQVLARALNTCMDRIYNKV